ncbi:potassium voltage-gated channel subfamily H member 8-like isoform X3 [Pomacea canaliculata]|uniref:potassium voltage-gated channel subfamily H member 8-like isoform X3 n=1 Tax=Pomacea canaliculata TaxID=400727 RepID=UPI000D7325F2|nr:potassium voltage-gated channel subfamily H member 8-like isoform X3 [Pomacea canaliculata]
MPSKRGVSTGENTFLDTIATRFDGIHSNFVLGNAQAAGWPIVYCSDGFCELTGYGRAQVMAKGCACKFLYGEETSETETKTIDEALESQREHKTELLLYKKNGNPFWCLMDIVPIKNEKRQVVLFLVSHKDISKEKASTNTQEGSHTDINDNTGNAMEKDDSDNSKSDEEEANEMPENYNYSRRRSRAVLYHISGQLNKQNKAKSKLQQLNRLGSQMPEYKVQEVKKSKLVIVHYGIFKIGWDWLILLCTFYIAIMVPFNAAFRKQGRYKDFIYIDVAVELLFAIDIVLNFRTSFVNKNGQVCYDSRLIVLNYMRGWFLLDLLAAIPFDLLYVFDVDTDKENPAVHMGTLIHLLKVARLLRLARLLQKIERYSQYSIFVVAILMCVFALLAHWLACIWYAIGKQELEDNPDNWTIGWLYELSERINEPIYNRSHPDTMTCYVTALYFTCSSLTSVGFGNVSANTNAEKIFSVCSMLVGAMMHALVFGNVTAFIQRMYARRANFHAKTKDMKEFFRFHHFPKPLKTRMQEYFQTTWSVNNGIDVREIMNDFPEDLRGEIGLHLNREILLLPIFQHATQACLRSLALQTSRMYFGPGEYLIHKGDAIRNIYYVCSGSMEVLKDEQVVAILGKGDLFGTDIMFDNPISISGCDVRSLAFCELLCINTQGLVECLQPYPVFSEKFQKEFPNDLTYNLREGHEDIHDDDTILPAINTLPVISEDEEEEEVAEKGEDDDKTRTSGDEDEGDHPEHSSTSPLLSAFSKRAPFPNGDIMGFNLARNLRGTKLGRLFKSSSLLRSESQKEEAHLARRGGTSHLPSAAHLRNLSSSVSSTLSSGHRVPRRVRDNKMRTCRSVPTGVHPTPLKPEDTSLVHNLQAEVEGTRATVDRLDRRIDALSHDVKNITSTLNQILRMMGGSSNQSKYSPPPERRDPSRGSASHSTLHQEQQQQDQTHKRQQPQVRTQHSSGQQIHTKSDPSPLGTPLQQPGASTSPAQPSLQSEATSVRPQFFFGTSTGNERFSDLFTSPCDQGGCSKAFRYDGPLLGKGETTSTTATTTACSRALSPTMSPLSLSSVNSSTRLLASDDEKGSPRPPGRDFHPSKHQYYKPSEQDGMGTNGYSSSSPLTPLSPPNRLDPRTSPDSRFRQVSAGRRRALGLPHPGLVRQSAMPDALIALDLSSSEESLSRLENLPLESKGDHGSDTKAPLSHAESFGDLASPQDTTEL